MIILVGITASIILIYLLYPLWLQFLKPVSPKNGPTTAGINKVSLILLSYNGRQYISDKIIRLQKELEAFDDYEMIIIDDKSTDGSIDQLNAIAANDHLKILFNNEHRGIPYAMNRAVAVSKFDHLIFCDQRQTLSENALKKIVEPLSKPWVGAVSGCISTFDKNQKHSFIRRHENYLKKQESRSGNLIGVYGPLYAIKKRCFSPIPENIILDDLYLSLRILKSDCIEFVKDCEIIDDSITVLYDYKRARRYLSGLLQILNDRTIYAGLGIKQHVMLLWHKYLRLLIPAFGLFCYITLGLALTEGWIWVVSFITCSLVAMLAMQPAKYGLHFRFKNLIRMNIFYLFATLDIMFNDIIKVQATRFIRKQFLSESFQ